MQLEMLRVILSCWWCRVGWTWEKEADVQDVLSTGQSSRTEQRDWTGAKAVLAVFR